MGSPSPIAQSMHPCNRRIDEDVGLLRTCLAPGCEKSVTSFHAMTFHGNIDHNDAIGPPCDSVFGRSWLNFDIAMPENDKTDLPAAEGGIKVPAVGEIAAPEPVFPEPHTSESNLQDIDLDSHNSNRLCWPNGDKVATDSTASQSPFRSLQSPSTEQKAETVSVTGDRGVFEDNLPDFMSKIEAGKPIHTNRGTFEWSIKNRKKPSILQDSRGVSIKNANGHALREVGSILPNEIPWSVPPWCLNYWFRKASEKGIDMNIHDVIDRMDSAEVVKNSKSPSTSLDNRLQRYISRLGQLCLVERSSDDLPGEAPMRTIADLTVLQGKLNTWWTPNHYLKTGPWVVQQPRDHPAYRELDGHWQGRSNVVREGYGLSERMKNLADGLVFTGELAIQEFALLPTEVLMRDRKMAMDKHDFKELNAQYQHWRQGGPGTPSLAEIRTALAHAATEAEILRILAGEADAISRLQTRPSAVDPATPSMWDDLEDGRVGELIAQSRNTSLASAHTASAVPISGPNHVSSPAPLQLFPDHSNLGPVEGQAASAAVLDHGSRSDVISDTSNDPGDFYNLESMGEGWEIFGGAFSQVNSERPDLEYHR